jgi:hypothetical protein
MEPNGPAAPKRRRVGFQVLENTLKGGACPQCGRTIPGVWT